MLTTDPIVLAAIVTVSIAGGLLVALVVELVQTSVWAGRRRYPRGRTDVD